MRHSFGKLIVAALATLTTVAPEVSDAAGTPVTFQLTFPVGAGPPDGVVRLAVKVNVSAPAVVVTAEETCKGATLIWVGAAAVLL